MSVVVGWRMLNVRDWGFRDRRETWWGREIKLDW